MNSMEYMTVVVKSRKTYTVFIPPSSCFILVIRGLASCGEIRCEKIDNTGASNDYTLVYLDTNSDSAAEGVIKVMGLHNFTAGDFIL